MNQILAARLRHPRHQHPTHWSICAQVTFPTEGLDLSPFASEDGGVFPPSTTRARDDGSSSAASGNAAGHYVAHRKDPSGWRTFDDTTHAPSRPTSMRAKAAAIEPSEGGAMAAPPVSLLEVAFSPVSGTGAAPTAADARARQRKTQLAGLATLPRQPTASSCGFREAAGSSTIGAGRPAGEAKFIEQPLRLRQERTRPTDPG